MECPQCRQEVGVDAAFCSQCGKDLRIQQPLLTGERRAATVLFSDLTGYTTLGETLDPEEVAQILAEIKDAATRVIESHGGTVNQFVGDEVMALFGIPVAHDDDPRRAVTAGLELHAFVRAIAERFDTLKQPLRMHSGVHTGLVVAQRRDTREGVFTATGDTVNTAARLLSAAGPDEMFIGPVTQTEISPYFETETVGELKLKGKAEPFPAHRVLRPTGARSRFEYVAARTLSPLTGRSEEFGALKVALERARKGAGFIHLVGEAGVGKSRLAHRFCDQSKAEGVIVLRGSCQAFGQVVPYLPFIEAMRRFLEIREQDHADDIITRVVEMTRDLGADAQIHVPVLLHLLSLDSDEHPMPPSFNPEELPRAIRDALLAALRAISARGPTLLHLEDWHWADEASAGLLALLGRGLQDSPILVLVDHRPTKEPRWLDLEAQRIELAAFGRESTKALVTSCLEAREVHSELLDLITQRTGGNPLFIEEVCASLRQQKVVVIRDGEVSITGRIEELEIPRTVEAVLQSRIDALAPGSRDVLRIASVVGAEVPLRVLARLTPSKIELDQHIERLTGFRLLQESGEGADRRLLFRHVTVQEVAYDTMLRRERAKIHAQVAVVLEEIYGEARIGEVVESLAHHYRLAGNDDKALVYIERAAVKATRNFAYAQARAHFGRAIDILERRDDADVRLARHRIDLTMRWAEVNMFGPSLDQIEVLESAQTQAQSLGDAQRNVTLLYWIAWVYYAVGQQNRAIELREQIVEMVRPAGDDATLGMMLMALGHSYAVACDPRATSTLEDGLARRRLANAAGERANDAHSLDIAGAIDTFGECQLAMVTGYLGDGAASVRAFRTAIENVRKTRSLSTESSNWITFGLTCIVIGDWTTAVETAHEARRIAEHMRSPYHLDTSDAIEGYALFRLGQRRKGRTLLQRGVEALEKSGMHLSMSLSLATYADVLAEFGEVTQARVRAQSALACQAYGERLGFELASRVLRRLDTGKLTQD